MLGRDDEAVTALERAHHLYLELGETLRAVHCAVWVCLNLVTRGEVGPAGGWLGRAQRLLEREAGESAEHGYLLLPVMFQHEAAGDFATAAAIAAEAAAIGERFGDRELFALAVHGQGYMLIKDGRVKEGLAPLDEGMVAVTAEQLSPVVTGIVYCGVILACQDVHEVRRAREWTLALTRWCDQQPGVVAFTGRCMVHRAEILQLNGAWPDALEEARRAGRRFMETRNRAAGLASYRQGELLRLQGEFVAAEEAYRNASRLGWEPQPGFAQLRLAQGRTDAAAAAIRRAKGEIMEPLKRAGVLPAYVEIMLALNDIEEARGACSELEELAERYDSAMLRAIVAHARGSVELANGDPQAALVALRQAWQIWHALEAPYEIARTRVLVGQACRGLGDEDAAALELEAARTSFEQLGAAPDRARVDSLVQVAARKTHGLSARELEVLRLVAAGKSNREIAAALVISEHTVARHLQNIFSKLRVASRTAATAFVGAAHSGGDIALEVATTHRTVLCGRDTGQIPLPLESRRMRLAWPVMRFLAARVLTVDTPIGRKMRPKIRAHGGPLLRVKRADLAAAGVERVPARMSGVQDGLPVLEDGRVLDVTNVIWCTGFRPDYSWIDLPVEYEDGYPRQLPGHRPCASGALLRRGALPALLQLDAHRRRGARREARRAADRAAAADAHVTARANAGRVAQVAEEQAS